MTKLTKVMLLFGGESSEHAVSISSARNVLAAIDKSKFEVELVYIDEAGKWWLVDSIRPEVVIADAVQIAPVLGDGKFISISGDREVTPDVILPILHGKNGEDGAVQALAALLHIPIVGCDMTSSAISMDKVATKQIAAANYVPVVKFAVHRAFDVIPDYAELSAQLGGSLFVKPSRSGSSVGAGKAGDNDELRQALTLAHQYDEVALIECNVRPRELEVAVLGNVPDIQISSVGEIRPDGEFYSYESKYKETSKSATLIPAEIDSEISDKIRNYAKQIFTMLGCSGLSRIDFFLTESGEIYFNEINTLPGFTNISMYPKLWRQEGLSYSGLIESLISNALEK